MTATEAEDYHAGRSASSATPRPISSAPSPSTTSTRRSAWRAPRKRRHARGDLVHGRDRRQAADRTDAEGCDRRDRSRRPATRRPITCSTARTRRISPTRLRKGEAWTERLRGLRANASTRSHAELDAAPDLDVGDPAELGRRYRALRRQLAALLACWAAAAAPIIAMSSRSRSPACQLRPDSAQSGIKILTFLAVASRQPSRCLWLPQSRVASLCRIQCR